MFAPQYPGQTPPINPSAPAPAGRIDLGVGGLSLGPLGMMGLGILNAAGQGANFAQAIGGGASSGIANSLQAQNQILNANKAREELDAIRAQKKRNERARGIPLEDLVEMSNGDRAKALRLKFALDYGSPAEVAEAAASDVFPGQTTWSTSQNYVRAKVDGPWGPAGTLLPMRLGNNGQTIVNAGPAAGDVKWNPHQFDMVPVAPSYQSLGPYAGYFNPNTRELTPLRWGQYDMPPGQQQQQPPQQQPPQQGTGPVATANDFTLTDFLWDQQSGEPSDLLAGDTVIEPEGPPPGAPPVVEGQPYTPQELEMARQNTRVAPAPAPSPEAAGPVPGSPAYDITKDPTRQAEAAAEKETAVMEAKKQQNLPKVRAAALVYTDSIDRTIKALEGIKDDWSPQWGFAAGIPGLKDLPMSPWLGMQRDIQSIQANIALNKLQEMRQNSPTGGAVGQLTDREREALGDWFGTLDPRHPEFLARVDTVIGYLRGSRQRFDQAFREDYKTSLFEGPGQGQGGVVVRRNPETGRLEKSPE